MVKERNNLDSFITRMWLDHCDENNDILARAMPFEEYKTTYYDWLKKQYVLKNGVK